MDEYFGRISKNIALNITNFSKFFQYSLPKRMKSTPMNGDFYRILEFFKLFSNIYEHLL